MSDKVEKTVNLPNGFRIAISWKPVQKELKLQVLDANDTEFDVVRISVRKKSELDRSLLLEAFITRNNLRGKPATEIMSKLGEITY
jgi:hypothetical protein